MGCHPTGELRDEHRLILDVVGALERFIDGDPHDDDAEEARRFVDFFSLYTDALHHGKEEDHLFDALVEHGFPLHQGPIAAMLEEHQQGRALVRQMADAVDHMAPGGAGARRELDRVARSYIGLLRQHIQKEDGGLFDMADNALDESACRALCDQYEAVCARRFAGRSMADLERLGAELVRAHTG